MSFDEFITYWTGKPVDFDGIYPNQCMDLMHQYVYDVLNITDKTALAQPSAYLVFTNFQSEQGRQYFELVTNTPSNVPQKGDIVVFGQQVGTNGHVCIFISGDVNSFVSFDANWPAMSLPHQQEHDYNGVLGWLHPIPSTIPLSVQEVQSQLNNQVTATTECQTQLKTANDQLNTLQTTIASLQKQVNDLQLKNVANQQEIITLNGTLQTLTGSNKDYGSEALAAEQQENTIRDYLHAIASRFGINTSEKDGDLTEAILTNIDVVQTELKNRNAELSKFQNSPAQKVMATIKNPSWIQKVMSWFIT